MEDKESQLNRLRSFFAVWYASEKLDDIADCVRMSEKQKIKNIAREFFRIESRSFKSVKPDGDMAQSIVITNEAIDKLIFKLHSGSEEDTKQVFEFLEMEYDVI